MTEKEIKFWGKRCKKSCGFLIIYDKLFKCRYFDLFLETENGFALGHRIFRCEECMKISTGGQMIIELDGVPPSQNVWKSWSWTRGGRMKQSRTKKEWENRIMPYGFLWKAEHGPEKYARVVEVIFYFPDNRRRDKDNYAYFKGIPDGLVKAGIIRDDNVVDVRISYDMKLGTGSSKTVIQAIV